MLLEVLCRALLLSPRNVKEVVVQVTGLSKKRLNASDIETDTGRGAGTQV